MKTLFTFLIVTFLVTNGMAATDSLKAGVDEIVVGAKFDDIKKFLEPQAVWPYFVLNEIKRANDKAPDVDVYGPKTTYTVSRKQTKFMTYMNCPVTRMEVNFNEENVVQEIYILIARSKENETKLRAGSAAKFAGLACAVAEGDPKFNCYVDMPGWSYSIENWDGKNEESYTEDKMLYASFRNTDY